jgi:hypothetical protein
VFIIIEQLAMLFLPLSANPIIAFIVLIVIGWPVQS